MKKNIKYTLIAVTIFLFIIGIGGFLYYSIKITKSSKTNNNNNNNITQVKQYKEHLELLPYKEQLDLLPPVFYINLEYRTDRKRELIAEFKKMRYPDDKITRVDAVLNKKNGHKGCLESHIKALKMGLKSDKPVVMIVEDDIMFLENPRTTYSVITEHMKKKDWNVLLLDCGGINESGRLTNAKKLRGEHSKNYRPGCATTTGYIIRSEYIPKLLKIWESSVGIPNWKDSHHACDQTWKDLQDEKWIVLAPKMTTQRDAYSDISDVIIKHDRSDNWKSGPDGLPIELSACQEKLTGMLEIFDTICKTNNIKYWAIEGTLLGVVRHNGWIPFDGDIDLGILQEDYEKFKKVCWQLPEGLWLQDRENDKTYTSSCVAKIRDIYSCYIDADPKNGHNGLQIDLFIFTSNKEGVLKCGDFSTDFIQQPKKTDIFPLKKGTFEHLSIPIPRDSHLWLKTSYGDYMILPPKDKRYPHEGACWAYKTCNHHVDKYSHLYNQAPTQISSQPTPRVCWAFWFGSLEPTPTRKKHLDKMRKVLGVEVILITCENIAEYLVQPVHAAVPYLSGIHKMDYFRVYFMLHYGGGTMDIKNPVESWVKYFDLFDSNKIVQVMGSPEQRGGVAFPPGKDNYKDRFPYLIQNGQFIARPGSEYMKEYHKEQHTMLDNHYESLRKRPDLGLYPPKREAADWDPYPLRWAEVAGEIHSSVGIRYIRNTQKIMVPIDVKTDYGSSADAPPAKRPTERSLEKKWIDEDFLKYYVMQPPPNLRMLAVSGYWNIGKDSRAEYGDDKYKKNFVNTTNFNTDYLIYGETDTTLLIKKLRGDKTTLTSVLSWLDLVGKCEKEFAIQDILLSVSKTSLHDSVHCPSAELLLIWLAKVLLVKESMTLQPDYTHYGWIDTGYKGKIKDHSRPWPSDNLNKVRNGLYIKRIKGACKEQYWKEGLKECPIGGMWFGDKKSITEFTNICIRIIKDQLSAGRTVCADQDIFELATREMYNEVHDAGESDHDAFFLD